jgi:uncharacterized protein YqjF (DUF2071 family)
MRHDFNKQILEEVAHRPWPMPEPPWVMTQTWHDLLFAHWPIGADLLAAKIPKGFELDTFEGQAWLGIVPFHMSNVAPRWVPALPWVSEFPELNVRTYVRVDDTPGVYFFSLDAGSGLAVQTARKVLNLPYFSADMDVTVDGDRVSYRSRRQSAEQEARFEASYRPVGPVFQPRPGTLDYFLTERYCLYAVDHSYRAYRLDIHHPPWPLQIAEAEIACNTMAEAAGLQLPSMAPLLHFSKRQDMVAWPPDTL